MPVSRVIEFSVCDPCCDSGIEPWMGGFPALDGLSDFGGGGGVLTIDDMESMVLARFYQFSACQYNELDEFRQALGIFPSGQGIPLVAAHDPEEAGVGKPIRHGLGGLIGVIRARLMEFEIIDHGPWQAFGRKAEHFAAILAACRLAARFVGRNPAREETDFIETQRLLRQRGELDVPEVDGIKGAAEQGGFSRRRHGGGD